MKWFGTSFTDYSSLFHLHLYSFTIITYQHHHSALLQRYSVTWISCAYGLYCESILLTNCNANANRGIQDTAYRILLGRMRLSGCYITVYSISYILTQKNRFTRHLRHTAIITIGLQMCTRKDMSMLMY